VEDDGPEGVPELPVAFNMSSHQDLSHHFKIICQLFVHLAVRSPSQRVSFIQDVKAGKHMNRFQRPFHMISEVCSDFVCSFSRGQLLLCRPVNGPTKDNGDARFIDHFVDLANEFKRVLEKYPVFSMVEMDFAVPGCDACNLGARMSKMVGRVSGQPYDRSTFEVWMDPWRVTRRFTQLTQLIAAHRRFGSGAIRIERVPRWTRTRSPRNRCIWGGSVPSELNHFTNSLIGR
jgi:hypothetical protein